jgi:hypothetical protein
MFLNMLNDGLASSPRSQCTSQTWCFSAVPCGELTQPNQRYQSVFSPTIVTKLGIKYRRI